MNNLLKSTQRLDVIYRSDCLNKLKKLDSNSIDFIITSPPYADSRKKTYEGASADKYVNWFLPISKELKRVLKPRGSFILNIKERVVDSERSTYVLELILEMRKQGWLWTEEYLWHKKILFLENGQIDSEMGGKDACILQNRKNSKCIKNQSWCLRENGQSPDSKIFLRLIWNVLNLA